MHYRGKRVPLSEGSPLFQRAGIPAPRSFASKRPEERKSFLFRPKGVQEGKRKEEGARLGIGIHRPGPEAEGSPFYRAPRAAAPVRSQGRSWRVFLPDLRWAMRAGALALLALALVWSKNRTTALLQDMAGLKLREVAVEGNHYLDPDEVVKTLALPLGESMFKLDLQAAEDRVRRMAWVERVFVERRLPRSILVSVTERKPAALLERGDLYGVDAEGRVLPPAPSLLRDDLPLISGLAFPLEAVGTTHVAEALKPALDFLAFLQKKDKALAQDVSEVNLSGGDSLKVTFMDGLQARFDPPVSETDLKRMALVVSDLQEKGRKAAALDFRYRDLVLVKPRL